MSTQTLLIVDDEPAIRDMLRMALEAADFRCIEAEDIQEAYRLVVDERPSLVLLDWMLPGGSGLELMRRLKREDLTRTMPIIRLEVGADDYISKPFAPRELIARIRALLRRASGAGEGEKIQFAELLLDGGSKRVFIKGQPLVIGPTEFKLLQFFMLNPERAYSRSQLLDQVWGANVYVEERTVDVHIRRLRVALQVPQGDNSNMIQTVRGTGYRFSARDYS